MVNMATVDTISVLAQRRHTGMLLLVAGRHEHEMAGTGQQAIVRRYRQFARQGFGVAVRASNWSRSPL